MIDSVDVIFGLAWGDEGKGKVTSHLANYYDMVCRWAGGNNAGHTVYKDGKKYKTHLIPSGIFHNRPSIIGPGCVVHWRSFLDEIEYLKSHGFDTSLVKISPRAHIVTAEHIQIDKASLHSSLGTTNKGIGPCYASKAGRNGILASHLTYIQNSGFLWDEKLEGRILCEGAQGFWLDIDAGNYPYVTSSTTLPYGACSLGFPPQKLQKIMGVAKIYDTRSGEDPDFPMSLMDNPELAKIGEVGKEYGVTTGRQRKVNYLNLDKLQYATNVSGCTHVVINKTDILEEVEVYKLYYMNKLQVFPRMSDMKRYIEEKLKINNPELKIIFSDNPERI